MKTFAILSGALAVASATPFDISSLFGAKSQIPSTEQSTTSGSAALPDCNKDIDAGLAGLGGVAKV
jgi:hypothetical protein